MYVSLTSFWLGWLQNSLDLAQDLLESVVEGPEGDNIYEIYVEDDDDATLAQGVDKDRERGAKNQETVEVEGEGEVDMEVYAAMEDVEGNVL